MPVNPNEYFICGKCTKPTHNANSFRSQRCKWCTHEVYNNPEYYCELCGDSRVAIIQYDAQLDLWGCPRCYKIRGNRRPSTAEGQNEELRYQPQSPGNGGRGSQPPSTPGPHRATKRQSRPPLVADPYANIPPYQGTGSGEARGAQRPPSGRSSRRTSMSEPDSSRPPPPQRSGSRASTRSVHGQNSSSQSNSRRASRDDSVAWCTICGEARPTNAFVPGKDFCNLHMDRVDHHWCATCEKYQSITEFIVDASGQFEDNCKRHPVDECWCMDCGQYRPDTEFGVDVNGRRASICRIHIQDDGCHPIPNARDNHVHHDQAGSIPSQQGGYVPGHGMPSSQPGMHPGQSNQNQGQANVPKQEYWCYPCNQSKAYFNFPIDAFGIYIPGTCNAHFAPPQVDPGVASHRDEPGRGPHETGGHDDERRERRRSGHHQESSRQGEPMRWCERCQKQRPKTDFNKGRDGRREPLCKRHHQNHQNRRGDDDSDQRHRSAREDQRASRRSSRHQDDRDEQTRSLAERFQRFTFT